MRASLIAAMVSLALGCRSKGDVAGRIGGGPIAVATSVLEHHGGPSRAGVYAQAGVTGGALHLDPAFHASVDGFMYAQPLFLDQGGLDLVIPVTAQNKVYALDAKSGPTVWSRPLWAPVPPRHLPPCNLHPPALTAPP